MSNIEENEIVLLVFHVRSQTDPLFFFLCLYKNESKFIEEIVLGVSRIINDNLCLDVAKHPVGLKPQVEYANLLFKCWNR